MTHMKTKQSTELAPATQEFELQNEERKKAIVALVEKNVIAEMAPYRKKLEPLITAAQRLIIIDQTGEAKAADIAKSITAINDGIETWRDNAVRPLNDWVKLVNLHCKTLQVDCESAKQVMRNAILAARAKVSEQIAKQHEAQLRKAAKAGKPLPPAPPIPQNAISGNSGQVSGRKKWVGEVVDEKKLPDMYWMVNQKAIDNAVKAGIREIAGVKIYQKDEVAFS